MAGFEVTTYGRFCGDHRGLEHGFSNPTRSSHAPGHWSYLLGGVMSVTGKSQCARRISKAAKRRIAFSYGTPFAENLCNDCFLRRYSPLSKKLFEQVQRRCDPSRSYRPGDAASEPAQPPNTSKTKAFSPSAQTAARKIRRSHRLPMRMANRAPTKAPINIVAPRISPSL